MLLYKFMKLPFKCTEFSKEYHTVTPDWRLGANKFKNYFLLFYINRIVKTNKKKYAEHPWKYSYLINDQPTKLYL